MTVGNDISGAQGQIDFGVYKNNTNFVIAKASEGVGFIDSWYGYNRSQSRTLGVPFGSYHFARPDLGNSAEAEAKYFCSLIDGDPIREGEILCLDFEVTYSDCVNWCKQWLDTVSGHFNGIKPYIYLNQAVASGFDWSPVANAGYPLWLASYQADGVGNKGKWSTITMQQWTSSQQVPGISGNADGDHFFGDTNAFKGFGYKKPVVVPPAPTPAPTTQPSPVTTTPTQPVQTSATPTQPTQTSTTTVTPTTTTSTVTPPVMPPVTAPVLSPDKNLLNQIHDVLWGRGWWWTIVTNLKLILPK
jgi:GH25 family lysozyme M1 (1,4-beta-N-acetylmuramidase)